MTPKSTLANVNAWVRLIIHLFIHARIHVLTHAPISLSLSHTKQTNKTNQNNTELDPLHQGLIVQRATLKARDYQIDLAANLNKTTVHSITGPLSQQAGFYCDVCDVMLKDSMAYLNHINGKWHNRALGMSMNVEKSTVDQVKKRLEEVKQRKKQGGARGSGGGTRGEGAGRRLEQGEEDGDGGGQDLMRGSCVCVSTSATERIVISAHPEGVVEGVVEGVHPEGVVGRTAINNAGILRASMLARAF